MLLRLSAFFNTISCCDRLVCAISRSSLLAETSAAARVTSIAGSAPISTCFLLPSYSFCAVVSACSLIRTASLKLTRSQ